MENDKAHDGLVEAVTKGDWNKATHLAAIKVAEMMERTESPRETKALSISLMNLIERCEENDVCDEHADTELARILAEADRMKRSLPYAEPAAEGIVEK